MAKYLAELIAKTMINTYYAWDIINGKNTVIDGGNKWLIYEWCKKRLDQYNLSSNVNLREEILVEIDKQLDQLGGFHGGDVQDSSTQN